MEFALLVQVFLISSVFSAIRRNVYFANLATFTMLRLNPAKSILLDQFVVMESGSILLSLVMTAILSVLMDAASNVRLKLITVAL